MLIAFLVALVVMMIFFSSRPLMWLSFASLAMLGLVWWLIIGQRTIAG